MRNKELYFFIKNFYKEIYEKFGQRTNPLPRGSGLGR